MKLPTLVGHKHLSIDSLRDGMRRFDSKNTDLVRQKWTSEYLFRADILFTSTIISLTGK